MSTRGPDFIYEIEAVYPIFWPVVKLPGPITDVISALE
jgi:hypothetical protein